MLFAVEDVEVIEEPASLSQGSVHLKLKGVLMAQLQEISINLGLSDNWTSR